MSDELELSVLMYTIGGKKSRDKLLLFKKTAATLFKTNGLLKLYKNFSLNSEKTSRVFCWFLFYGFYFVSSITQQEYNFQMILQVILIVIFVMD